MKIKGKQILNNTITESHLNLKTLLITSITDNSTVLDIQGVNGQLFMINDSLVGDIFTVSDISGMPILNVNSSGLVSVYGDIEVSQYVKNTSGNLTFSDLYGTYTLAQLYSGGGITSTDLSTGLSQRVSTDVSLSQTISTGLSQRVSTDVSLSTNILNYLPISAITDTKGLTGFIDGNNITVTYNWTNRTITLNGSNLSYYWLGVKKVLGNGTTFTSSAHTATVGTWFLYSTDGVNVTWSQTPWTFSALMVAYVNYQSTSPTSFAIKECHGIMDWVSHEEFHSQVGTYLKSGGKLTAGTYTENSATDANTTPGFDAAVVKDEDCETNIGVWPEGTYTTMYVNSTTNTSTFNVANTTPFIATTNTFIQVNDVSAGTMSVGQSGRWYNVYQIIIPTSIDTDSGKYRMIMLQPQATFTSLAAAQAEDPRTLRLGGLTSLSPEFVIHARITYVTASTNSNIGKCAIAKGGVTYVLGNKMSQISVAGVAGTNHTALSNLTWNVSGHLGDVNTLAGFDSSGNAVYYTMSYVKNNTDISQYNSVYVGANSGYSVTTYNSFYFGNGSGYNAIAANDSLFIGHNSGYTAFGSDNSIYIGYNTGYNAIEANYSIFLGAESGNAATGSGASVFIGRNSGKSATYAGGAVFIGYNTGCTASGAYDSIFIGTQTGYGQSGLNRSILLGYNVGNVGNDNTKILGSSNIIIGTNITLPPNTSNSLNIGGVLFGNRLYSTTTTQPLSDYTDGAISIGAVDPGYNKLQVYSSGSTYYNKNIYSYFASNGVFDDFKGKNKIGIDQMVDFHLSGTNSTPFVVGQVQGIRTSVNVVNTGSGTQSYSNVDGIHIDGNALGISTNGILNLNGASDYRLSGLYIEPFIMDGASGQINVQNVYGISYKGVNITNHTSIVNSYGLYIGSNIIGSTSSITNNYGIYQADTVSINYFGGKVAIGSTTASYPLHVSGSVSDISIYATNDIVAYSDESVKTNLEIITNAIEKIKQINGYTFDRIDSNTGKRRAGVIAQEVEKILPEVIAINEDGTRAVAYGNMVALLIEAIKEQQIEIDQLKELLK